MLDDAIERDGQAVEDEDRHEPAELYTGPQPGEDRKEDHQIAKRVNVPADVGRNRAYCERNQRCHRADEEVDGRWREAQAAPNESEAVPAHLSRPASQSTAITTAKPARGQLVGSKTRPLYIIYGRDRHRQKPAGFRALSQKRLSRDVFICYPWTTRAIKIHVDVGAGGTQLEQVTGGVQQGVGSLLPALGLQPQRTGAANAAPSTPASSIGGPSLPSVARANTATPSKPSIPNAAAVSTGCVPLLSPRTVTVVSPPQTGTRRVQIPRALPARANNLGPLHALTLDKVVSNRLLQPIECGFTVPAARRLSLGMMGDGAQSTSPAWAFRGVPRPLHAERATASGTRAGPHNAVDGQLAYVGSKANPRQSRPADLLPHPREPDQQPRRDQACHLSPLILKVLRTKARRWWLRAGRSGRSGVFQRMPLAMLGARPRPARQ